jgi:Flp pilus assembly protein TadD
MNQGQGADHFSLAPRLLDIERRLNTLGCAFIRSQALQNAIRVFQLDVEGYPHSSNVYDNLAKAHVNDGNGAQVGANYEKALRVNPNTGNAAGTLRRLACADDWKIDEE